MKKAYVISTRYCGDWVLSQDPGLAAELRRDGHRVLPSEAADALALVHSVFKGAVVTEIRDRRKP